MNDDGTFSFVVPTAGLHGTQALRVRAAQGSGPAAVTTVVLYEDMRGLPLSISSPADGSCSRSSTILEGSVGDETCQPGASLRHSRGRSPRRRDLNGHAVVDKSGSFKLAIPFSGLSGDVTLTLTAQDKSGHLTERTLTLHDGTKPGLTVTAPSDGGAFGSLIRVGGSATDPRRHSGHGGVPVPHVDGRSYRLLPTFDPCPGDGDAGCRWLVPLPGSHLGAYRAAASHRDRTREQRKRDGENRPARARARAMCPASRRAQRTARSASAGSR